MDGREQLSRFVRACDIEVGAQVASRRARRDRHCHADRLGDGPRHALCEQQDRHQQQRQQQQRGVAELLDEGKRLCLVLLHHQPPPERRDVRPRDDARNPAIVQLAAGAAQALHCESQLRLRRRGGPNAERGARRVGGVLDRDAEMERHVGRVARRRHHHHAVTLPLRHDSLARLAQTRVVGEHG